MTRDITAFQERVWEYYRRAGRHDLPWRQPESDGTYGPYKIVVSEFMLQQTQVVRVLPKFVAFTEAYPNWEALASASLADVLRQWSGLGYNRRAKYIHLAAQQIVLVHQGSLPKQIPELVALPGIGPNTAGAIMAYAYNRPVAFIETNIRTVFIHHFFADSQAVHDRDVLPLIRACLPLDVRSWYWALMDYGTYLKRTVGNANRRSISYTKQSRFEGSRRQIRGMVLKLLAGGPHTLEQLTQVVADDRMASVLADLVAEGFVCQAGSYYQLCT
ncbi:MAG TPA: hypothetical protein VIR03_03445 [Candidatus Saccharimonadales bacterium]